VYKIEQQQLRFATKMQCASPGPNMSMLKVGSKLTCSNISVTGLQDQSKAASAHIGSLLVAAARKVQNSMLTSLLASLLE
jgi:hypothetical protein